MKHLAMRFVKRSFITVAHGSPKEAADTQSRREVTQEGNFVKKGDTGRSMEWSVQTWTERSGKRETEIESKKDTEGKDR